MCHVGTKGARPSIAPLSEPQWGLPLTEPPHPYSLNYNRRNRGGGRKLSTPSTSRTPAARRGEPSTNLLAGLVAPPPTPRLGKFHRLAVGEEQGTQDWRPRAHQARQQGTVRLMEDSNAWGSQYLWTIQAGRVAAAIRRLKPGKSPGLDCIFPEFILNAGSALGSWFCDFFNSCIRQLKIPKIWRRALVVAIPKPEKPLGDPKSYRPISLLCVPFKILERLIYARVETIIDPLLQQEQAGFRHASRP